MATGGGNNGNGGPKKRPRVGATSRVSSTINRNSSPDVRFDDSSTADVILRLYLEPPSLLQSSESESISDVEQSDVNIYLHSHILRRSKYFSTLLSDRWQHENNNNNMNPNDGVSIQTPHRLNLKVSTGSLHNHITVLQLLYTNDFSTTINTVSAALYLLPVALELLFEDCVRACVKFLEAVPWTEEEESLVLNLIPFLNHEESKELVYRVCNSKNKNNNDVSEEMLHGLIVTAMQNHPNMAFAKAFVAKLLRDFSCRESAKKVLDGAFGTSLKVVKESVEEYSSPDFRGDHNETEAIQRLNLHTAMTNSRHLLWLVERMIELRVADKAVRDWSELASFTSDLQRTFRDDTWWNIAPGLPAFVLRITCKLATAVASGSILANRQVRMKLVKDWLPVLIVCKDKIPSVMPNLQLPYRELEEAFLRIISTLPMSDAQELLKQCLSFSTRNVEDCPHLVNAFKTWFRRANRSPQVDFLS